MAGTIDVNRGQVLLVAPESASVPVERALSRKGYLVRRVPDAGRAQTILLGIGQLDAVVLDAGISRAENARVLAAIAGREDLLRVPVILTGDHEQLLQSAWAESRRPSRAAEAFEAVSRVRPARML